MLLRSLEAPHLKAQQDVVVEFADRGALSTTSLCSPKAGIEETVLGGEDAVAGTTECAHTFFYSSRMIMRGTAATPGIRESVLGLQIMLINTG